MLVRRTLIFKKVTYVGGSGGTSVVLWSFLGVDFGTFVSSKGVLMQVPRMRMLKFCEHQKLLEHQNSLGRRTRYGCEDPCANSHFL